MHYNKEKVEEKLEWGIDDPADMVEELFHFINKLLHAAETNDVMGINTLKKEWYNYEN